MLASSRHVLRQSLPLLVLALCTLCMGLSARAETIILAADRWCPYNCEPDTTDPGYMVEVAQRIFARHGYDVEYRLMSWKRAIEECRTGTIHGIIGALRSEAPDCVFPESPLGKSVNAFFSTDPNWHFTDKASLKERIFGICEGYSYGPAIDALIESRTLRVDKVSSTSPLELNIRKMLVGRIFGIVANRAVFRYMAAQHPQAKRIHYGGQLDEGDPMFIAFSPNLPRSTVFARLLDQGIRAMRKSGELAEILAKYAVSDWQ